MKVKVIGGHGGVTPRHRATSFLINDDLLIDAGSVASGISIQKQNLIDSILISHAHLDHIKDLAFICDNCLGQRETPFRVYSHKTTIDIIKTHFMNDLVWPDFSKIPSLENPTIVFETLSPLQKITIGDLSIQSVPVNHPSDAMGFIIEDLKNSKSLLFTLDTGPTELIWEQAKKFPNLKGIFTEVSFPNHLQKVADLSFHHTPRGLTEELKKMPSGIPVYIGHIKPNFEQQLQEEIRDLGNPLLSILDSSGMVYTF